MKRVPIKEKVLLDESNVKLKTVPSDKIITLDLQLENDPSPASLRLAAKLAYVTSLTAITVPKLNSTPPFNRVSLRHFKRWALEDKWTAERDKYRNKLEKKILNKLSTEHVDSIVAQLENADNLARRMYTILDNEAVSPKSFEGMVSALMKLEDFRFTTREKVAQLLTNQIQMIDDEDNSLLEQVVTPSVSYNGEALLKLAHAIIKKEKDVKK